MKTMQNDELFGLQLQNLRENKELSLMFAVPDLLPGIARFQHKFEIF